MRLELHEPPKGVTKCDLCGRFVSYKEARLSHEFGDYGTILSTEALCPKCAEGEARMTAAGSDEGRDTWREDLETLTMAVRYYDGASNDPKAREALARVAGELERLERVAEDERGHAALAVDAGRFAEQEVARLRDGLRGIQAVAVMTQNEHARTHRLDWLREIEDRARSLLSGGQAESTKGQG